VQPVTALPVGLKKLVFIAKADDMVPGYALAAARATIHDSQDMVFHHTRAAPPRVLTALRGPVRPAALDIGLST
jgi:hypothetical protein